MTLPKLTTPTFFLTVPSTKKEIKYRPFLVKEEKVLLLIKESKDPEEIANAMNEIVTECTFGELKDDIPVFDLEYVFLQLRSKSVGEVIELSMKCLNEVPAEIDGEEATCGGRIDFSINISDIKVKTPEGHTNTFILDKAKGIGVVFKYPNLNNIVKLEEDTNTNELISLVDNIFDKDNVYDAKDVPKEEIQEFFELMTKKQSDEIKEKFFDLMPNVSYTQKYKCPECGYEGEYTFRGIVDFF